MTKATDTPDLLAAASLLLTLITFLYGLLYPELSSARAITLGGRQPADLDVRRDRDRVQADRIRALALGGTALVVGAVFAPPSANLAWHFLRRIPNGFHAFAHYNAVAMTLGLVTAGCFRIAIHAAKTSAGLTSTLAGLEEPSPPHPDPKRRPIRHSRLGASHDRSRQGGIRIDSDDPAVVWVEVLAEAVDTVEVSDSARVEIVAELGAAGAVEVRVLTPEEAPRRSIRVHVRFRLEVDQRQLRERVEQVLRSGRLLALGGGGWRVLSVAGEAGS